MEQFDTLKPIDKVEITIEGPEGTTLYESTGTGYHSLSTAIAKTVSEANLGIDAKDCVFKVNNLTTEVTHRYRLNAHGNLKLIV